ncbi:MAG: DUF721 domain-containing protein [Planctomycetota bacterium]
MRARANERPAQPQRRAPVALQSAIRSFLQSSGIAQQVRHWPVYEAWSDVLGSELARRAVPVSFANGSLCVEVESSSHLHELKAFTGEDYRRRANQRLGREEIKKIAFRLKR